MCPVYTMARKYKRSGMRRRKGIRRRKHNKNTTVIRGIQPIPSRYICKQKYSQAFDISALQPTQVMNLNSLYDPDRSGIGHQPFGFDQLASLYNRYRVISCSYVVNCYSSASPIRFGTLVTNDLGAIGAPSASQLAESPYAKFKIQVPGGAISTLRGKCYIPTLMGRSKTQYMSDDRYQADVASSPAELALLYITANTLVDSNVAYQCTVTLEYTVEYFDRKQLTQS